MHWQYLRSSTVSSVAVSGTPVMIILSDFCLILCGVMAGLCKFLELHLAFDLAHIMLNSALV